MPFSAQYARSLACLETYTGLGLDARTNRIRPPDHCHVEENHVTGACDLRASVFDFVACAPSYTVPSAFRRSEVQY